MRRPWKSSRGSAPLPPIQWATTLPDYWCRPRLDLVKPWQPIGTPELGAWHGTVPTTADPLIKAEQIRAVAAEVGPQLAQAVEAAAARAAAQMGTMRPPREVRPLWISPIIATGSPSSTVPPGYFEISLKEVFTLAGLEAGNIPDAVGYATERPATREQARELLRNTSMTVPR